MKFSRLFLSIILIVFVDFSLSGKVYISDSVKDSLVVSDIQCFIDFDGQLSFDDVIGLEFENSLEEASRYIALQNPSRQFWFKFKVEAVDSITDPISVAFPRYSNITVFVIENGQRVVQQGVGSKDIGQYYVVDHDQSTVPLFITSATSEVIVSVRNITKYSNQSEFYLFFGTQEYFQTYKLENRPSKGGEGYVFLLFLGIMLFQALYVLIQWYLVRKSVYFFYVLYILSVFAYYYLRFSTYYSENATWSLVGAVDLHNFNLILLIVPSIFYLLFASTFADLKTRDQKLHKGIYVFVGFLVLCVLVQFVLNTIPNDFDKLLPVTISLFAQIPFNLYALIRIARQRRRTAWFLVAGSTVAFVAHLTANFLPSLVPQKFFIISPLEITMVGVILEVIIFNSGLLFKAKEAESDKVAAQNRYIKELKARQHLQGEFAQVRDKISSDLHDDVGSSLSSIGIYSYAARENLNAGRTEQAIELLDNIKKNAESTMNAMSDLVWATNPQNDSNEKLIERIQSFGFEILGAKECTFKMVIAKEFYEIEFNQAQRKNLLLILKEAINNAAKYSQATLVNLTIDKAQTGFEIVLKDNGIGFKTEANGNGNGMRTMKNRTKELRGDFQLKVSS
ncbi:MAG: 7TM diverse intracellular signaling domain-containing protein [Bacteroidota bacterium]